MPLEFSRAWLAKVEAVRLRREELAAQGRLDGLPPELLAREGAALHGTLRIPVIPVRYTDVAVPFHQLDLERRLFGSGTGDTISFRDYWAQVSGGLLNVEGVVTPWIRLKKPAQYYLPAREFGWSKFGRVADLREEALRAADRYLDFAQFDNDGPDGKPNSGDDDGFVDFVALVYALPCPGDSRAGGIWPHRAAMPPFETSSIGADGKPIRIADYVVLPAVDPVSCGPLHIGVLAHETGHALGLPDLYDYDGPSVGIGSWGLMGTGSHAAQHSPAHPGAWEKEQLGWVKVAWLNASDTSFTFQPVQVDRTVYRFDGDDGEYILIENRQRTGSDRFLPGRGLLVWEVDPERAELGAWNNDDRRAAVAVVEADGRGDLRAGRRADSGDPFPGRSMRTLLHRYEAGGLHLSNITQDGDVVRASLALGSAYPALVPDADVVRISALAGGGEVRQSVALRSSSADRFEWHADSPSPWLRLERTGDVLTMIADPHGLEAGVYEDTVTVRDSTKTLARVIVNFYLATPGVGEIIATELPWSWGVAVRDGRIVQASYGWDPLGLRPRPRVLQLREGAFHPETLARIAADALYAPIIDPRDGSTFVLARGLEGNHLYRILESGDAEIIASKIGAEPAYGAAMLPDGSIAVAEWSGAINRVSVDGSVRPHLNMGSHIYQIASDAAGNLYAASFDGNVIRVTPSGERRVLETGFGEGRLVAIATTPSGDVIAAERGGQSRIVRLRSNGTRDIVYRSPGAQFYGVAVDDRFVFALDLTSTHRHLLRVPLPPDPNRVAAGRQ